MPEVVDGPAILDGVLNPLDVIELRVTVDSWEAGTIATVLEVGEDTVLAEIADEDGRTLEIITVPVDATKRLEAGEADQAADVSGRFRTF